MPNRTVHARVALVAMLAAGDVCAQARDEQSARDAVYECPVPKDSSALLARAGELGLATYDRNRLGCAADLYYAAARAAPDDPMLNLQALLATLSYVDAINTLWDYDIYGIRAPEWTARLEHAIPQGQQLAARLATLAPEEPTMLAARAIFDVTSTYRTADAKTQLETARAAIATLEKATAQEPAVLEGAGLLVLGKLSYDLPEFSGGDIDRALAALDRARELAPRDPSVLRYYAYALTQERSTAKAREVLTGMLDIEPVPQNLQRLADELAQASDLAVRLQAPDLQQRLQARREALLAAHAELLTRASSASNMHGGVDPITGQPY